MQASQATRLSDSVIEILNHCKVAAWPQPQIPGSQVELHSLTRISSAMSWRASNIVLALEMQSVAVGWQVYDITKRPLDLGLIGLAQFLPGIVLFLPAGHAADRFDRRNLLTICYLGFALASGLLLATAWLQGRSMHAIYAIVVFLGIVRTFNWPVSRALLPQLVAEEHFPSAVAWNSSIFQGATILGPAAGGVIYAFFRGPATVYASAMLAACAAMFSTLPNYPKRRPPAPAPVAWDTVLARVPYVWPPKGLA